MVVWAKQRLVTVVTMTQLIPQELDYNKLLTCMFFIMLGLYI